jgi:tetratricopeptide (TPR) repeat protein
MVPLRPGGTKVKGSRLTALAAPLAISVAVLLFSSADGSGGRPVTGVQVSMQELFRELSLVYRLSLDETLYQDPANRDQILTALYALAANAGQLGGHGSELNACDDFHRRSLVRDTNEAVMRYRQGQFEGSRFLVDELTKSCFCCHSQLPEERRFELGRKFIEGIDVETLTVEHRACLLVAMRQFDAALDTYEELFTSPAVSAGRIAMSGAFEDYLKICLRVKNDYDRAIAAFETFRRRPDLPQFLDSRLDRWLVDLMELKKAEATEPSDPLYRGRVLVRDAQYRSAFPNDPQGTVRFIAASGHLYRNLRTVPKDPNRLSETYYLLGVAESHISPSYWRSEADYLLETAIRTAPASVYGRMAYNFLEEYTVSGYTGSSGVNIPPDVQARLDELRSLVNAGR